MRRILLVLLTVQLSCVSVFSQSYQLKLSANPTPTRDIDGATIVASLTYNDEPIEGVQITITQQKAADHFGFHEDDNENTPPKKVVTGNSDVNGYFYGAWGGHDLCLLYSETFSFSAECIIDNNTYTANCTLDALPLSEFPLATLDDGNQKIEYPLGDNSTWTTLSYPSTLVNDGDLIWIELEIGRTITDIGDLLNIPVFKNHLPLGQSSENIITISKSKEIDFEIENDNIVIEVLHPLLDPEDEWVPLQEVLDLNEAINYFSLVLDAGGIDTWRKLIEFTIDEVVNDVIPYLTDLNYGQNLGEGPKGSYFNVNNDDFDLFSIGFGTDKFGVAGYKVKIPIRIHGSGSGTLAIHTVYSYTGSSQWLLHNAGVQFAPIEFQIIESDPLIHQGIINPRFGNTADDYEFEVTYTDKNPDALPPSEVRVYIDGTGYAMTKDPVDDDFSDGVEYTYSSTFDIPKIYQYSFGANANDGTALTPYPENGTLNFVVGDNPEGWDIRVTDMNSSPSRMEDGQTVSFTATVHNNSNTYDKIYSNVYYEFELFNPSGSLINESSGTISSLNQGSSINVSGTLNTQNTEGAYSCIFTIYPSLDTDGSNNTMNEIVIVGNTEPTHQYIIEADDEDVFMGVDFELSHFGFDYVNYDPPTLDYNGRNYSFSTGDYREFDSQTKVVVCEGYSNIYYYYGIFSFGSENSTDVTYDETTVTCIQGEDAVFTARTDKSSYRFESSTPDIYNSSDIGDNSTDWDLSYEDSRYTMNYIYTSTNSLSPGTYNFTLAAKFYDGGFFIRDLTLKILPKFPVINNLSSTTVSADDVITITGTNLESSGTVRFGNIEATTSSWTSSSITCTVPQNIVDGVVTVSNTNGTSNGIPYTAISATGNPELIYEIPDQTLNPAESRLIADLNDVFEDPNGGILTYSVESSNPNVSINAESLGNGILQLTASVDFLLSSTITITATDNTNKSVSDEFIINAPEVLTITPLYRFIDANAGTVTFSVTSNVDWSPNEDSVWLTASKTDESTLTVTYEENIGLADRSADITVSGEGVTPKTVTVEQEGVIPYLIVTPEEQIVGSSAGSTTFTVTSNVGWSPFEDSEQFTASKTDETILTVTYGENTTGGELNATITVSGPGVTPQSVSIIQLPNNDLPVSWEVNPNDFSLNGSITAQVYLDDVPVTNGFLAAFVGSECRGIAEASDFSGQYYVFSLMCYSNTASGETLYFKYFSPTENRVYDLNESLEFSSDMIIGSAIDPFEFHWYPYIDFSKSFTSGWNWFSVNVVMDDMSLGNLLNQCTTVGDYVKDQTSYANYYEGSGWFGTLSRIDPKTLYKTQRNTACDLTISGTPVDVGNTPINIVSGLELDWLFTTSFNGYQQCVIFPYF